MADSQFTCNCDVIHEDIVNDVKKKMQSKEEYIELASLFKLFGDGTRVQILHALEQSNVPYPRKQKLLSLIHLHAR